MPFRLDREGLVLAKLLPTQWNAVNNGTPNGTAGTSGWWVSFHLADGARRPLTQDATGANVSSDLGTFVRGTPTRATALHPDTPYHLVLGIHVPAEAAIGGSDHRVVVALVFRAAETATGGASGAGLEQSRAYTERIVVAGAPQNPGDGGVPTNGTENLAGAPAAPAARIPDAVLLVGGLAAAALIAASVALAVAGYALRTVTRTLRRSGTAEEDDGPFGPT